MAHANGYGLRALQKSLGPVGKFFEVHALLPKLLWRPLEGVRLYPECSAAFSQHKYVRVRPDCQSARSKLRAAVMTGSGVG